MSKAATPAKKLEGDDHHERRLTVTSVEPPSLLLSSVVQQQQHQVSKEEYHHHLKQQEEETEEERCRCYCSTERKVVSSRKTDDERDEQPTGSSLKNTRRKIYSSSSPSSSSIIASVIGTTTTDSLNDRTATTTTSATAGVGTVSTTTADSNHRGMMRSIPNATRTTVKREQRRVMSQLPHFIIIVKIVFLLVFLSVTTNYASTSSLSSGGGCCDHLRLSSSRPTTIFFFFVEGFSQRQKLHPSRRTAINPRRPQTTTAGTYIVHNNSLRSTHQQHLYSFTTTTTTAKATTGSTTTTTTEEYDYDGDGKTSVTFYYSACNNNIGVPTEACRLSTVSSSSSIDSSTSLPTTARKFGNISVIQTTTAAASLAASTISSTTSLFGDTTGMTSRPSVSQQRQLLYGLPSSSSSSSSSSLPSSTSTSSVLPQLRVYTRDIQSFSARTTSTRRHRYLVKNRSTVVAASTMMISERHRRRRLSTSLHAVPSNGIDRSTDDDDDADAGSFESEADESIEADQGVGQQPRRPLTEKKKQAWQQKLDEMKQYQDENDGSSYPPEGYPLRNWADKQRSNFSKDQIYTYRIELLNSINFQWSMPNESKPKGGPKLDWGKMFDRLVEYKERCGDSKVPQHYPEDQQLGTWCWRQKFRNNKGTLDSEEKAKLDGIGFVFHEIVSYDDRWDDKYGRLDEYRKKNNSTIVPRSHEDDPELGGWVKQQRHLYNRNDSRMTPERVEKLEAIGFVWNAQEAVWLEMYGRLVEYWKEEGHSDFPTASKEDPKLGTWVSSQRQAYKKGKLSPDRIEMLEAIGFKWSMIQSRAVKAKLQEKLW